MNTNTNTEFLENKKKQKIIIIWQARAACSSVMKMFFEELNVLTNYYKNHSRTAIHQLRQKYNNNKYYKFQKNMALKNPKTKYIQFTVNPFRRAVSSYIHQMRHNYCISKNNNISFSRFLLRLQKNKYPSNYHHDMQYSYLENEGKKINYIKMEDFYEKYKKFNKKFHLNFKLIEEKRHQKYSDDNNYYKKYIGNHKWSKLKGKVPKNYKYFYNSENIKKVLEIYSKDFQTFHYTWKEFIENENR